MSDFKQTKEFQEVEKVLKHPLLDPKNPLWLDILRYVVIIVTILLAIASTLGFILSILQGEIFYAIGALLGGALSAALFYVMGMISLNTLFNIQQIRINTDALVKHVTEKKE